MAIQTKETAPFEYSYARNIVGYLSYLVFARTTKLAMAHFAAIGLTTKEGLVLEFVANNPQASQKDIAFAAGMKPSFLVKILDNLTARGLLRRVPDPNDRRRHHLRLTPAGAALRDEIRACHLAGNDELFAQANFSAADQEALLGLMQKLTAHIQEA